ncbi:MAG: hypothetical protein INR73_19335 [Williamsia sp.]|nr:hypothetical protein [Williamsia sp.]
MKLKLIEAGKFSGLKKTAEEDLDHLPQELQQHVENIFSASSEQPLKVHAQSAYRDKEKLFIEYNGKALPINAVQPSKQLEALIEKLKSKLHY